MTDDTGVRTPQRVQSWPPPDDRATGSLPPTHRAEPTASRPRRRISVRITAGIAALAFLLGAGLAMLLGPMFGGPGGGGPGGQPPGTSSTQTGGTGSNSGSTST